MKRFYAATFAIAITLSAATGWALFKLVKTGDSMTVAAATFLDTLTGDAKAKATMAYDDPKRVDWHFIPKPTRKGLQVREMNDLQRKMAHALLKTALSEAGYKKATTIMSLENLLADLEKGKKGGALRDSERYFFTIFGTPSNEGKWGLSVEGHHLSLNFVVENGEVVSSTPTVYGANPAVVMESAVESVKKGTRVLAKEEQLAFDLLASLTAEQRKTAVIAEKAIAEIRAAGEPQPPQDAPVGIAAGKLNAEQMKTLHALVQEYANNLPADVAEARLAKIKQAGVEKVYFAWAGADKPGIGHYYRIQGPTFLIEFVNTQPDGAGNPANHIHSIWRDMAGDFAIGVKK
jgi:hypothetical protein